ncbi:MAG: efflux RND transporter periplasmic adaptor subunit, partial [Christensenellaceae bacterium]
VKVSENEAVSSSETLMTLSDTADSANYDAVLAERAEMEETLQQLVTLYKEGAVLAPFDGRIESVAYGEEEQEAATGAAAAESEETLVLSLDPNEKMTVAISVDETDVLSLQVGQEATVSVESIGDETYAGTVTDIDTTASIADGVTQYTATVTVERTEAMLAGMTATASITIEGVDNALLLPEDAVRKTSATAYVYTSYDEASGELGDMVEVTVGLSNGSYIEITEGLNEGDTVYYMENEENTFMGNGRSPFGGGFDFGGSRPDTGNMPGGNMPGGNAPSGDAAPGSQGQRD